MELLWVRHGEPERIAAGSGVPADPALTERGRDQAVRLAAWLADEQIDVVLTSPQRRAVETAAPIARAHGIDVEIVPGLIEYDASSDSYIPMEELRASNDPHLTAMYEGRWEEFGAESTQAFRARVAQTLDDIVAAHPGQRVVAVCHGGVINVAFAVALELDRHLWFEPHYTSLSRMVASRTGVRSVASLNERAHLDATRDAIADAAKGAIMSVDVEHIDRVTVVTINRPAVRNAVDRATAAELADAFRAFEADDAADVAVLTGAGGTFCAGADLKAIGNDGGNTVRADGDGPMGPSRMLLSKPVIAAVEGFAVAGGLELALWCDLRVAARDAVFGVFCRRWGVPLIDGGTVRLPRLIGHSHALDLILTGRGVSGDEALRMGLANRLTDPGDAREHAIALAGELSALPQTCLREDRASSYDQCGLPLDAAIQVELEHGLRVLRSGESFAGAERFAEGAGRHGSAAPPPA